MFDGESIRSGWNFGGDIRLLQVIRILTIKYMLKILQGVSKLQRKGCKQYIGIDGILTDVT